jgi:hypothetical protein
MTDPINGRVTLAVLHDEIRDLRSDVRVGFAELNDRLRVVEREQDRDSGGDLLLREQREIRAEQGLSRRWMVALAVGTVSSIALGIAGLLK